MEACLRDDNLLVDQSNHLICTCTEKVSDILCPTQGHHMVVRNCRQTAFENVSLGVAVWPW